MWQDWVIALGQAFFIVAQIYNIRAPKKPPTLSCAITATWLWVFAGMFVTLALPWSAATSAIGGLNWTILLWQTRR